MLNMMDIVENRVLETWRSALRRHPEQRNKYQGADAELIPISGGDRLLALTVDTVAEEIALGLYRDPEQMGWMAATVSLSDLAAVGASPIGILSAVTLAEDDPSLQRSLARGLDAACEAAGAFVLGGDTNAGPALSLTTCAVGLVRPGKVLTRIGCAPGDRVYSTGLLGGGAAHAAAALFLPGGPKKAWCPSARVREGQALARWASAAMDTSDGAIATLDQLARLNQCGIALRDPVSLLSKSAQEIAQTMGLPPLALLAGHHGEYELLFTLSPRRHGALEDLKAKGIHPVEVGEVVERQGIFINDRLLDSAAIRNLAEGAAGDPEAYLKALVEVVRRREEGVLKCPG